MKRSFKVEENKKNNTSGIILQRTQLKMTNIPLKYQLMRDSSRPRGWRAQNSSSLSEMSETCVRVRVDVWGCEKSGQLLNKLKRWKQLS